MSSLTDDQGSCPEEVRGWESTRDSIRNSPSSVAPSCGKSATLSSNGSASSQTAESLTLRSISPTPPPQDSKKVDELPTLPSYVSKSKNAKFHKLFKNVPLNEYPIDTYSCAFKGDILLQGMMYVSQNWICFYSKIKARGRLLELPLEKVISITREKMALIIPNAIGIQMADTKYVFGSFMSRDNTYKLLVTLLKHSQDSAILAGRHAPLAPAPALHGSRIMADTNSADITPESDTTEDDEDDTSRVTTRHRRQGDTRAVAEKVSPSTSSASYHSSLSKGGCAGDGLTDLPASNKVPGFFSWKCMDYRRMASAISSFNVKLQKVPKTNLLLVVCSIMVVFLMLSSAGLTYKILLLQTRLEMSPLWTSATHSTHLREENKVQLLFLT